MSLRVFLVDDHNLVRSGIRSVLAAAPGIEVIGEADNGRDAVEMARRLNPHVVLMDLAMEDLNGLEATRQIDEACPGCRVLVLSMHEGREYVFEALRAGARGYVLKSAAVTELLKAIREVAAGRRFFSPSIAAIVMDDYADRARGTAGRPSTAAGKLTAREREVLQLISEGRSSAEVAQRLRISARTVETHRQHIMEKTGIRSIAGLTRFAIQNGISAIPS